MKTETLPTGTLSVRFEFEKKGQHAEDMQDTLFDIPETLSPRLIWMRDYNIKTQQQPHDPEHPWIATMPRDGRASDSPPLIASGDTEDAALTALALAAGIRLWFETQD